MLHIVGRDADAAKLLRELKMTWEMTDKTVDDLGQNVGTTVFRKRGATGGRHVNDVSYYSIMIKVRTLRPRPISPKLKRSVSFSGALSPIHSSVLSLPDTPHCW